jgi:hypothetical protein
MKRIAFLVCGMLLLISNTAEARRNRGYNGGSYMQSLPAAPVVTTTPATAAVQPASATTSAEATSTSTSVETASATTSVPVRTASYSTSTAQGVANIMASYNRVGHWGGNPGYEGCGCGATPAAAYSICCYGNSGMATVDVGYAQASNGMWYCCRRYR